MADHDVFDAHFHVIDPRYPLVPNDVERIADAVGAEYVGAVLAGNARALYRLS